MIPQPSTCAVHRCSVSCMKKPSFPRTRCSSLGRGPYILKDAVASTFKTSDMPMVLEYRDSNGDPKQGSPIIYQECNSYILARVVMCLSYSYSVLRVSCWGVSSPALKTYIFLTSGPPPPTHTHTHTDVLCQVLMAS